MHTDHVRAVALLDAYYAQQLGCPVEALAGSAAGPAVVALDRRAASLGPRVSPVLVLFRAGGGTVASSVPAHADAVRRVLPDLVGDAHPEEAATRVAARLPDLVGEARPGAWAHISRVLTAGRSLPAPLPDVRVAYTVDRRRFWAVTAGEERASHAEVTWYTASVANISVETWPRFRRQGYGRAAVAEAVRSVCEHGDAPLYLHRIENAASAALAQAVGLEAYGWLVEVSALDLPADDARRLPDGTRGAVVTRGVFEVGSRAAHWHMVYPQQRLLESAGVASAAQELCAALAVPGRVAVLQALLRAWGAAHVEDLASACGLDAAGVRTHCRALCEAGLACDHLGGVFSVWPHQVSTAMGLLAAAAGTPRAPSEDSGDTPAGQPPHQAAGRGGRGLAP